LRQPSKIQGGDAVAASGDWLFRQGELVLGPVPAGMLVEKLYAGEVDARTEISLLGAQGFTRLGDVDYFRLHLAKAQAKLRVDAVEKTESKRMTKSLRAKIGGVVVVALVIAAGMAVAARYFAVHNPLKDDADALAFAELGISMDVPVIRVAKRTNAEELVDYPGGPVDPARKRSGASERARSTGTGKTEPLAARTGSGKSAKMTASSDDPDGMQMGGVDQDAINAVVAKNQKSLYPCLIDEAKRKPGLQAKIPIEFSIGNNGRVSKVWVDHPSYKEGPLPECLLKALQKWPFKPNESGGATVGLSFNIGKKS
jgi:hypothetical protein